MSPFTDNDLDRFDRAAERRDREAQAAREPAPSRTGWPPGMLQDDSRELSRALAGTPDAKLHAKEAAAAIRTGQKGRMPAVGAAGPNVAKLTAADLDFAQTFTGEPDEIVTDEAYLPRFPSLEIPQPTEALHIGRNFKEPPPVRDDNQGRGRNPKRATLLDWTLAVLLGLAAYGALVEWSDEAPVHFTAWTTK